MEEGSLLQQVLADVQSRRDRQANEVTSSWTENLLLIDVFARVADDNEKNADADSEVVGSCQRSSSDLLLLRLALLADELNNFIRGFQYPWHVGGDGLVFGIHTTSSVPHLRGACYYGANVMDEWMAVAMMKRWSSQSTAQQEDVALRFWDVQDGHILLIQTADVLPEWVDRIGPQSCQYRCWMIQGQVTLIAPPADHGNQRSEKGSAARKNLNLPTAYHILCRWWSKTRSASSESFSDEYGSVTRPRAVQKALHQYLYPLEKDLEQALSPLSSPALSTKENCNDPSPALSTPTSLSFATHCHRTAILLPKSISSFFHQRPDLLNTFVIMFQQLAECQISLPNSNLAWKRDEDWVWTKISMSKTNYAMLRTIDTPLWQGDDSKIPALYQTTHTLQLHQQLQSQDRHVQHALQLGIRLTAGIDYVLFLSTQQELQPRKQHSKQQTSSSSPSPSLMEQRIQQHWKRIHRECCGGSGGTQQWPTVGDDNVLHQLRNCPVYDPELLLVPPAASSGSNPSNGFNPCPLTRPGLSLALQIKTAIEQQQAESAKDTSKEQTSLFNVPRPDDVDDEESWMVLSEKEGQALEQAFRQQSPFAPYQQQQQQSTVTTDKNPESSSNSEQQQLDDMLDSFQSFMTKPSEVEGVDTTRQKSMEPEHEDSGAVVIKPRVFLNLLHAVLQATRPEDLNLPCIGGDTSTTFVPPQTSEPSASDPYFSDDDYNDMADSSTSDDGNEEDLNGGVASLQEIMTAMDEELRGTKVTMDFDHITQGSSNEGNEHPEVQQQAHVLSNLLKSLEAAGGGSGPVRNIMREMGVPTPDLPSSEYIKK